MHKSASFQELLAAVRGATQPASGGSDEERSTTAFLVKPRGDLESKGRDTSHCTLSERELGIMLLVGQGLSNR